MKNFVKNYKVYGEQVIVNVAKRICH